MVSYVTLHWVQHEHSYIDLLWKSPTCCLETPNIKFILWWDLVFYILTFIDALDNCWMSLVFFYIQQCRNKTQISCIISIKISQSSSVKSYTKWSNKTQVLQNFIYTCTFEFFTNRKIALPHSTINQDIVLEVWRTEQMLLFDFISCLSVSVNEEE